jgi:hypothetical protein
MFWCSGFTPISPTRYQTSGLDSCTIVPIVFHRPRDATNKNVLQVLRPRGAIPVDPIETLRITAWVIIDLQLIIAGDVQLVRYLTNNNAINRLSPRLEIFVRKLEGMIPQRANAGTQFLTLFPGRDPHVVPHTARHLLVDDVTLSGKVGDAGLALWITKCRCRVDRHQFVVANPLGDCRHEDHCNAFRLRIWESKARQGGLITWVVSGRGSTPYSAKRSKSVFKRLMPERGG